MKRCSISLAIKEMQIEVKMRYHFILTTLEKSLKQAVSSVGEDMEQLARWELVGITQINMHIPYLPASS